VRPQTIDKPTPTTNPSTRGCHAPSCSKTTREGKPFCPDHVERHDYVQGILEILEARRAEEDRVRKVGSGAVDPRGLTAQELMLHLSQHGSRTVERLSREFQLEAPVMRNYVQALLEKGLVQIGRTTRGSTIVRLAS
jgi:predicted HTH transcriptional regulator